MNLDEVLHGKSKKIHPIVSECAEFLIAAEGQPLLKNLPAQSEDFRKVKLRLRKNKARNEFAKTFNEAFNEIPQLRQRALFANGPESFIAESGEKEPFYIFPTNGFKFMYSLEVSNSNTDYMDAFDTILEQFHHDTQLMEQVLKYTYTRENLAEGIQRGSEIIVYNIPYCYAIRESSVPSYEDLIEGLRP